MELMLNGTPITLREGATLAELLDTLDLGGRRVAVEVNAEIVPRGELKATLVRLLDALCGPLMPSEPPAVPV